LTASLTGALDETCQRSVLEGPEWEEKEDRAERTERESASAEREREDSLMSISSKSECDVKLGG
jgi:hypothetical protein